jgi:hypothetical protein
MKNLLKRAFAVFLTLAVMVLMTAPTTIAEDTEVAEDSVVATSEPIVQATASTDNLYISTVNPTENGGWLEISNPTDHALSTKGLYLSNDDEDLFLWQMPAVIIREGQTVRVAMNSNGTCEVLKRLRTNFDIADGDTVRLNDVHGELLSEVVGSDEPRLLSSIIFRTGDMEQIGDYAWGFTPQVPISFIIPNDQNIESVEFWCDDAQDLLMAFPNERLVITLEGWNQGISLYFTTGTTPPSGKSTLVFA